MTMPANAHAADPARIVHYVGVGDDYPTCFSAVVLGEYRPDRDDRLALVVLYPGDAPARTMATLDPRGTVPGSWHPVHHGPLVRSATDAEAERDTLRVFSGQLGEALDHVEAINKRLSDRIVCLEAGKGAQADDVEGCIPDMIAAIRAAIDGHLRRIEGTGHLGWLRRRHPGGGFYYTAASVTDDVWVVDGEPVRPDPDPGSGLHVYSEDSEHRQAEALRGILDIVEACHRRADLRDGFPLLPVLRAVAMVYGVDVSPYLTGTPS